MKKNTIKIALRFSLIFSLLLQVIDFSAQEISRTFSKTIEVSPQVEISTKGPRAMTIEMSGKMQMTSREDDYILLPGGNDGVPALIIKDYIISTWKNNEIKQTVDIKILPNEKAPQEATDLMNQLAISLQSDRPTKIRIDDNMNISKINMINGIFQSNKTSVILEDGRQFRVKSLTIKSSLQIPYSCHLNISSEYVGIYISDFAGKLQLDLGSSNVTLGNVNQLEARLRFSDLTANHINSANIITNNSQFSVEKVDTLNIGSSIKQSDNDLFLSNLTSFSSQYKLNIVDRLTIHETANDQFQIGSLNYMLAINSTFSNYDITSLQGKLSLSAKNGDLNLQSVKEGFESITIDNQVSTVNIGLENTLNYQVEVDRHVFTEFKFPKDLSPPKNEFLPGTTLLKGNAQKAGKIILRCDSCTISLND